MKDFARFFRPQNAGRTTQFDPIKGKFIHISKRFFEKRYVVVWDSRRRGTYIKSKHGEL